MDPFISEAPKIPDTEEKTGEELVQKGEEEQSLFQKTGLFIQVVEGASDTLIQISKEISNDLDRKGSVDQEERAEIFKKEQIYMSSTEQIVKKVKEDNVTENVLEISNKYEETQKLRKEIFHIFSILGMANKEDDTKKRAEYIKENLEREIEAAINSLNDKRKYVFGYGRQNIEKGEELKREWYKTHIERKILQSEIKQLGKVVGPEGKKQMEEYNGS